MTDQPIFKSRSEQAVEARFGRDVRGLLREMYHDRRLTQAQIADELGVSRGTVVDWMQRWDIPTGYNKAVPA